MRNLTFVSFMVSSLLSNKKTFASHTQNGFFQQFSTQTEKIITLSLILFLNLARLLYTKWPLVNAQINIEQHGYLNSSCLLR